MRPTRFVAAVAAAALMLAVPAAADEPSVPEQLVDALNTLFGKHPGARANHAKGVVVEGSFVPSPEAATLSKASLFAGPAVPATVRFSDATGVPTIPDGSKNANPHGLAVKFKLTDGSEMDVVVNSLKFFPVATGEEFRDLLLAAARTKPDTPRPTPMETFVAAHPAAKAAGESARTPSSLARETYNGVNALYLVAADGTRRAVRFRFVPVAGEEHLSEQDATKRPPDFLMDELRARLGREPVMFRMMAQMAEPGDPVTDATKPWPEGRRLAELGTLTLAKAAADSAAAEKDLLFLPNALPDGIEVSDDPLIDARVQSYAVSFGRRQQ